MPVDGEHENSNWWHYNNSCGRKRCESISMVMVVHSKVTFISTCKRCGSDLSKRRRNKKFCKCFSPVTRFIVKKEIDLHCYYCYYYFVMSQWVNKFSLFSQTCCDNELKCINILASNSFEQSTLLLVEWLNDFFFTA